MEPGQLKHRFIVAGERSRREDDEAAEATRALREMISGGKLTKLVAMKEAGRIVTQRIEQEGPISYIESTTLTKIFDEDANRCLLVNADERTAQTSAIINRLAASYGGAEKHNVEGTIQKHSARCSGCFSFAPWWYRSPIKLPRTSRLIVSRPGGRFRI